MVTKRVHLQGDSAAARQSEIDLGADAGRAVGVQGNTTGSEWSTKSERQEFFLPYTSFAWFYPEEVQIIDHPAFQRLGRINQLGQAHYVYRGATHKRIEHVLGVTALAQRMISAINFNSEKLEGRSARTRGRLLNSAKLSQHEERFIRLAALLHDIGHIAAGHTIEDELELIGKHDADARITLILEKDDWWGYESDGQQSLGALVDALYARYLPPELAKSRISPSNIARLLIRKQPKGTDDFAAENTTLTASAEIRYNVCANIVANTICADLLDYIYRDWYHIGKQRSFDDRIFQYMGIKRLVPDGSAETRAGRLGTLEASSEDRFVIDLGSDARIRTDGVSAILGLLEWRYELAETVLFHRTKLSAGAMLDRALFELWGDKTENELVSRLLLLSDEQLLDSAYAEAAKLSGEGRSDPSSGPSVAKSIIGKLQHRRLFKELHTSDLENVANVHQSEAKNAYAGLVGAPKQGAKNRNHTARLLESDFDLPIGSVAVYCALVKPKIAQVMVAVDDKMETFAAFEERNDNRLAGGHLAAQIARFDRLWKIIFFIDRDVYASLNSDQISEIQDHIENVVVNNAPKEKLERRVLVIAEAKHNRLKAAGKNSLSLRRDLPDVAMRDDSVADVPRYPSGAPAIRAYLREEADD